MCWIYVLVNSKVINNIINYFCEPIKFLWTQIYHSINFENFFSPLFLHTRFFFPSRPLPLPLPLSWLCVLFQSWALSFQPSIVFPFLINSSHDFFTFFSPTPTFLTRNIPSFPLSFIVLSYCDYALFWLLSRHGVHGWSSLFVSHCEIGLLDLSALAFSLGNCSFF